MESEHVGCQPVTSDDLTIDDGYDILSKLSAAWLHQIRHVHEATAPSGACAVVGVFLIDVTSEPVHGNFGRDNLRDLHATL